MPLIHPHSLQARARGADRLLPLALAVAGGLLLAGWTWPMMTVSRLVLFQDRVSLLGAAGALWTDGDWLLFAAIALFALAFPLVKLVAAAWVLLRADARRPGLERALDLLDWLGRWSMLDVFVAALLVVALKGSLVGEVRLHAGIYLFAGAVLLSIACTQRLRALARRAVRARRPG